ncbi:hypothetical protein M3398_00435 [Streptomyces albidoflavus]|jgi:hypothetical protein|uniref:hypothetical protein n=1 Tax=Streptomyces TaxID=1883 RepID=UPI00190B073D|nr:MULTISPECIES: hypothetical protein [Streptomyces]MBK3383775.1 hypothetical protein [Streptomyces sp. DEF147AK]MBK3389197.1 hypothetical protein [Streptomyces sp. DEF1AK]MCL6275773.1 hypothetical protein [Streptomyces albidoflavus]MCX4466091.1 hypothetical protein [Streptomyces albidoflavus]WSI92534.1 hypothetical protein OG695_11910 [Streptomyces albidoflavus]
MSASQDPSVAPQLLPVSGAELRRDPALHEAVRRVGQRVGVDFTDDERVREELKRGREATSSIGVGGSCLAALLVIAAIVLPFAATVNPALAERRPILLGAAGVAAALGIALMVRLVRKWHRAHRDPVLAAYREVLALARAHGVELTHVPDWLVGKSSETGRKPSYPLPDIAPVSAAKGATPPSVPSAPRSSGEVRLPRKPSEVTVWEQSVDKGGWYGEVGLLAAFAGAGAAMWASIEDEPAGYAGLGLGVAVAITLWVVGYRQGVRKKRGREAALRYLADVQAAQAAGASVPELSPQLQKLLGPDDGSDALTG